MRLTRRGELYLPLLLLIPALLGRAEGVQALLWAWLMTRLATLCAAGAFRRAAAGEVSDRRVRGLAGMALLWTLAAGAAAWRWGPEIWRWLFAAPPDARTWNLLAGTGGLLALARLQGEILRARAQEGSAEMCDFLTALMLAAAILCGGPLWWLCAAALAAALSVLVALAVGGRPYGFPRARLLAYLPGAAVRELLYPLPGLLLVSGFLRAGAPYTLEGYLLGLAAFGCAASPFRRSEAESSGLNLALLLPAVALAAAAAWLSALPVLPVLPALPALPVLFAAGCLCAMAVNAALTPRTLLAMALTVAVCALPFTGMRHTDWGATAWAAAAVLSLLPDVRRARLRRRAARLAAARLAAARRAQPTIGE